MLTLLKCSVRALTHPTHFQLIFYFPPSLKDHSSASHPSGRVNARVRPRWVSTRLWVAIGGVGKNENRTETKKPKNEGESHDTLAVSAKQKMVDRRETGPSVHRVPWPLHSKG